MIFWTYINVQPLHTWPFLWRQKAEHFLSSHCIKCISNKVRICLQVIKLFCNSSSKFVYFIGEEMCKHETLCNPIRNRMVLSMDIFVATRYYWKEFGCKCSRYIFVLSVTCLEISGPEVCDFIKWSTFFNNLNKTRKCKYLQK